MTVRYVETVVRRTGLKTCTECKKELPVGEFNAYRYVTAQGKESRRLQSQCRRCGARLRAARRQKDLAREMAMSQKWKADNPERAKQLAIEYRRTKRGKSLRAAAQRRRYALTRILVPVQGDAEAIKAIYKQAVLDQALISVCPVFDDPILGRELHVDHVMPLSKGGRHAAGNLQILPIGLNMRKGARIPDDKIRCAVDMAGHAPFIG